MVGSDQYGALPTTESSGGGKDVGESYQSVGNLAGGLLLAASNLGLRNLPYFYFGLGF